MNITVNPIEVNTQLIIKCKYCNEVFQSQATLDSHINEKHPINGTNDELVDEINDELQEITFDIVEDINSKYKNLGNKNKDHIVGEDYNNAITEQPGPYIIGPIVQVPPNRTFCCCIINNNTENNDYQQYNYRPEHNPEGCCDCEGVDCDNCWDECGNCDDCNCNACCRECGDCNCNCDCDNCVLM